MMQAQEYDDEQPQYMPYGNRPMADESLGSLQYQLDSNDIIEDIKHILKNEDAYIENGAVVWKRRKGALTLINEQGITNILSILKSRVTKIMILSDLEQSTIEQITSDIHEDLTDDFYYNWEKYQIKDLSTASLIVSMVTDTVYASLRKGYMGNYMKLLRSMHSIQEIQSGQLRAQQSNGNNNKTMTDRLSNILFRRK